MVLYTLIYQLILLIIDDFIDQDQALNLLFQAFRLNEVGVIEKEDRIIIALLNEILQFGPPVVGPDVDIMRSRNRGTIIQKVYRLSNADAESVSSTIEETLPDWVTMTVNVESNQIVLQGDVGLCQRVQEMIDYMDRVFRRPKTQTFRLAHADANEVAQQILDLFEDTGTSSTGRSSGRGQTSSRRGMKRKQVRYTT